MRSFVAIVLAAALYSCGSDSDSESNDEPTETNDETVAEEVVTDTLIETADSVGFEIIELPTHPIGERVRPHEVDFQSHVSDDIKNYYSPFHVFGWSDDGKLAYVVSRSGIGMAEDYQMVLRIQDMLSDEVIEHLYQAEENNYGFGDIDSFLETEADGIYKILSKHGIKPLQELEISKSKYAIWQDESFKITHDIQEASHDRLVVTSEHTGASVRVFDEELEELLDFGKMESEYVGYFYSHDQQRMAIVMMDVTREIEGAILHQLRLVGCTFELVQ